MPEWQNEPPAWASPGQWQRFTDNAIRARSADRIEEMKQLSARFRDPAYLKTVSLDELGIAMEWSIHGWMHMRWSGKPLDNGFSTGVENDWLFVPWSSHVNAIFWKLHPWIDQRIDDWGAANQTEPDLSNAWSGPPSTGMMPHMAEKALLDHLPARETEPLPMMILEHVVEGLLSQQD